METIGLKHNEREKKITRGLDRIMEMIRDRISELDGITEFTQSEQQRKCRMGKYGTGPQIPVEK